MIASNVQWKFNGDINRHRDGNGMCKQALRTSLFDLNHMDTLLEEENGLNFTCHYVEQKLI